MKNKKEITKKTIMIDLTLSINIPFEKFFGAVLVYYRNILIICQYFIKK